MEGRNLLDHVVALLHAFDEAWGSIAPTIDPASVKNARRRLADAIIAHASTLGTDDLAALKAAALASFSEAALSMPVLRRQRSLNGSNSAIVCSRVRSASPS
jgi:hypothetical protein